MASYTKETTRFLSADGKTQVAAFFYSPTVDAPKAVIQISHGMCEYIGRYEPTIEVLAAAGFAVCGNDHLGHGYTSPGSYGFKAEKDGYKFVLEDLHTMSRLGHEKWPGIPYFLLGHSMGSFYGRWFGEKYPENLDGLIISGTGGPSPLMPVGKALASLLSKLKGPRHVSEFMVNISMGSYCNRIEGATHKNAWLSRDSQVWDRYQGDDKCGFPFTVSAYRDMLTAYCHVSEKAWAENLRKGLPIYIYSGDCDPVGDYGKGVRAVHKLLEDAGIRDLTLKIYPGARHEMHNELNKDEVFADLIGWINARI